MKPNSISKSKRAEEKLRESEERFRNIFENASDGIYQVRNKSFVFVNPRFVEITGYSVEEVTSETFDFDTTLTDRSKKLVEERRLARQRGESIPSVYEMQIRSKDGSIKEVELSTVPLKSKDGVDVLGFIRDITERKRAEEALKKSSQLLRDSGEMAKVGGWELDLATNEVSWTEEVCRIHGVEPGYKPKLEDALNFYAPESRPALEEALKKVAETGEPYDLESLFVPSGGKDRIWVRSLGKAVYSGGKIVKLAGTFQNIDKYKRAEEALREAKEFSESLIASARDGISVLDNRGVHIDVNPALCEMTGFLREELIGVGPPHPYWPPELYEEIDRSFRKTRAGDFTDVELTFMRKNGERFPVIVNPAWIKDPQGNVISYFATVKDITERKRAEEAQRASEASLAEAQRIAHIGNWDRNIVTNELYWSNEIYRVFGLQPQEFGATYEAFLNSIHPDDREYVKKSVKEALHGDNPYRIDHRIVLPSGEVRIVHEQGEVAFDESGEPIRMVGTVQDITERKRAEEEIRRKAKELQEKNDELNRFTSAISHDLRSPLVTIQTFQGHLERDIRSQDAARVEKDLGYIRNAADKMGRLLDELRRFSRVGRIINPSEEAPLQAIVKEALSLAAGRIAARGVRIDLTEEPVVLYGDRTRLVEIFLNLVDNAIKFMGDEPAPRVEIGAEQTGEEIVLHLRDNGIGINPEVQSMIFDLFRKLNPGSEGEGIGLSLVKRIVELHGGRIWVESEGLGKGTTFRFTLAKTRRGVGREERT